MSRQPSPGLPHSAMYHQLPPTVSSSKQKTKGHVPGITAGAEDVKYQAKYRELKKKVKEIEFDNDKLYLKLLVAKKNIRRMNLERAILYERLAAVPPTPGRSPQELPQEQDPLFAGPPVVPPDVPRPPANDRELDEYMRQHPNARVIQAADGRIIDIEDGSGRAGALGLSAPPDAPPYRREPTARYEGDRQPQVHGGPVPQIREPQPERVELPPDAHRPSRSSSAYSNHHRSRSSTARQDVDVQGEPRIEPLQPAHTVHSRSASIPDEPRRRHEHHNPPPPLERVERSPSHSPVHSPSHNRSLHNHQRIGPGVHLHRSVIDMDPEERAKLLAERRKEEEREKEREVRLRERLAMEAMEEEELRNGGTWPQEDAYMAGPPRGRSRSDTPVSGGVTRESSRPPADPYRGHTHPHTHSHHYERDAYYERRDDRLPVDAPAYAPEYRESRKRTRQEMEVDDDREMRSPLERTRSAGSGGGPAEAFPVSQELRGPRRGPSEEPDVPRVHTSSIRDEKPMDQDD